MNRPTVYQIRVKGHLGPRWADWFEGLEIALDGEDTLLTGPVADQAALHGLLRRVRDLGLPLVSVTPASGRPSVADAPGAAPGNRGERPGGRADTLGGQDR